MYFRKATVAYCHLGPMPSPLESWQGLQDQAQISPVKQAHIQSGTGYHTIVIPPLHCVGTPCPADGHCSLRGSHLGAAVDAVSPPTACTAASSTESQQGGSFQLSFGLISLPGNRNVWLLQQWGVVTYPSGQSRTMATGCVVLEVPHGVLGFSCSST